MNFCIVGKVRALRTNLALNTAACFQIQQLITCSYFNTKIIDCKFELSTTTAKGRVYSYIKYPDSALWDKTNTKKKILDVLLS